MADHELLKSALTATPECLAIEELEAIASAATPDPGDKRTSHLADCSRCQTELALLRTFLDLEPLIDEGASVAWITAELERRLPNSTKARRLPTVPWWPRIWRTTGGKFVLAAAALATLAVAIAIWIRPSEPTLIADAGPHNRIMRSEQVVNLRPAGDLPGKPIELQWKTVTNAASYKVDVMEVDETVLWTTQTNTTVVSLPANVRDKMLPGKPILWRVAAVDAEGTRIATSQIERFRVVSSH